MAFAWDYQYHGFMHFVKYRHKKIQVLQISLRKACIRKRFFLKKPYTKYKSNELHSQSSAFIRFEFCIRIFFSQKKSCYNKIKLICTYAVSTIIGVSRKHFLKINLQFLLGVLSLKTFFCKWDDDDGHICKNFLHKIL